MAKSIMDDLKSALKKARKELQKDAKRISDEISRIDTILRSAVGRKPRGKKRTQAKKMRGGKRHISAAGRARIAAAQRKRWAKIRAKRSKRP